MSEENISTLGMEIAKDVSKEIAKDAYTDLGHPVAKPTGELIALVPRAIKAALAPVEKWIIQREYNIAETKKLLEEKLKNTPPEQIESPEPYVAIPALQCISYCMDTEELRDMYANLLANSMNRVVKNGVHPGFVEIIKQLSPDEAKFLKYMQTHTAIPTISLRFVYDDYSKGGIDIIKEFTNVPILANCEQRGSGENYIDNLTRLGLLTRRIADAFTDKTIYEPLKTSPEFSRYYNDEIAKEKGYDKCDVGTHIVQLTAFGKQFCDICLSVAK